MSAPAATITAVATTRGDQDGTRPLGQPQLHESQDDRCRGRCERKDDQNTREVSALGLRGLQRRAVRRERMRPRSLEHAERGGHAHHEPRDEQTDSGRVESYLRDGTSGQRYERAAAG